jgi:hypothetical protein
MAKAKSKNWIAGRWLIESMDQWDRDYIDEEVRGNFTFDERGSGHFQFGYVQGQIDYRCGERDGKPVVEFSWAGFDGGGGDECTGRGWMLREDDTLTGMFFFHLGDESAILLQREPEKKANKRK